MAQGRAQLALGLASELEPVGVVHQPIEDGVGDGGVRDALVPLGHGDLGGFRSFGVNYGLVFSAWGVGGFVMSRASQSLAAATGSFDASFFSSSAEFVGRNRHQPSLGPHAPSQLVHGEGAMTGGIA